MGLFGHLLTREGSRAAVSTVPRACRVADAGSIKAWNIMWVYPWVTHLCPLSRCLAALTWSYELLSTSFCGSVTLQSLLCYTILIFVLTLILSDFIMLSDWSHHIVLSQICRPDCLSCLDIFSHETRWQKCGGSNSRVWKQMIIFIPHL